MESDLRKALPSSVNRSPSCLIHLVAISVWTLFFSMVLSLTM